MFQRVEVAQRGGQVAAPGGSVCPVPGVVQSGMEGQLGGKAEDRTSHMFVCDHRQPESTLFCRLAEHFSKELVG